MQTIYKWWCVAVTFGLLASVSANGQVKPADSDDDNYHSVTSLGITTNTNAGLLGGFVFRQSKLLPGTFLGKKQFRYLAIEAVNVKHPKEIAQMASYSGTRFTYGKENYLFVIRPQYGREISLFQRSADEGITINGIFAVGPSLGIIKPYYVEISEGNRTRTVSYATAVKNSSSISGAGGFFQGFGESKFTVGVNVKAAVSFELSAFRNNTTGLEIGFLAEAFPQKIVIMPGAQNRSFFTSGFVSLYFGSKK